MHTSGTTKLSNTDNEWLKFLAGLHHEIGHFVDDNNDIRHFARGILFFFGIFGRARFSSVGGFLFHFFVVFADFFDFFFGHQWITAVHFANGPFHSRKSFSSIGNNWGKQMWNVVVGDHFDLFRINDDEAHIRWSIAVKKRHNKGVGHDRLTWTSGTGDEEVRHASEVGNNRLARNIFTDSKGKRIVVVFPFFTFDNSSQWYRGRTDIRYFNTDKLGARDWSLDTNCFSAEIISKFFIASGNFGEIDTAGSTQSVLCNARANIGVFHFDFNTELGKGFLNDISILFNVAWILRDLFFAKQSCSWHFPIWIVERSKGFFFGFFLGFGWFGLGRKINFGCLMRKQTPRSCYCRLSWSSKAGIDFDFELAEFVAVFGLSRFFTWLD